MCIRIRGPGIEKSSRKTMLGSIHRVSGDSSVGTGTE